MKASGVTLGSTCQIFADGKHAVREIAGVYLDPPEKVIVLCVDETVRIKVLDRTASRAPARRFCC